MKPSVTAFARIFYANLKISLIFFGKIRGLPYVCMHEKFYQRQRFHEFFRTRGVRVKATGRGRSADPGGVLSRQSRSAGAGVGVFLIQWSVRSIPRATSRLGMWQSTQPDAGETGQGVPAGPSWQARQAAS